MKAKIQKLIDEINTTPDNLKSPYDFFVLSHLNAALKGIENGIAHREHLEKRKKQKESFGKKRQTIDIDREVRTNAISTQKESIEKGTTKKSKKNN